MSKQREALRRLYDSISKPPMSPLEQKWVEIIEEALAEPGKANQCGETCERAKLCAVCANGLAEPEQEPVAWMHQPTGMPRIYSIEPIPGPDSIPLYTAPPARKPLTDDELWAMWVESPSDVLRFARAIERAHGIGE